jgi:poly(hydroxyalkanoate) depolymerase family esterase
LRKLSDTVARLAALRAQHAVHAPDQGLPGRLSTWSGSGSNPGGLKAHFYLPKDLPADAPLVVVLHGCTQNAASYDHRSGWSQLADRAGFALLYPEQQRANNPNLCFNWFLPADTARGSGEVLSIRQMIEAMVSAHGLDRSRIFVTGLSAGGAMAAAMLATYPEIFAGGAIIAGIPYGSATTVPEAVDRMRGHGGPSGRELQALVSRASTHTGPWPRISIWHGSADQTVAPSNAEAIATQWRGVHGLDGASERSQVGRHSTQVWTDGAGEPVIEINLVAGMGHGTPLGGDGLGAPGPYMLDVGISSTREIAQFWGIAETETSALERPRDAEQPPYPIPALRRETADAAAAPPATGWSAQPESESPGVRKIIEDALRAAGLMR